MPDDQSFMDDQFFPGDQSETEDFYPTTEYSTGHLPSRRTRGVLGAAAALLALGGAGLVASSALGPSGTQQPHAGVHHTTPPGSASSPAPSPMLSATAAAPAPPAPATVPSPAPTKDDGDNPRHDQASHDTAEAPSIDRAGAQPRSWPAPPRSHVSYPWKREGHDYGRITAARMAGGRAVITVDRMQIFTAEQWHAKTGEHPDHGDFVTLNANKRTRDFTIEPGAPIYLWSDYTETGGDSPDGERVSPREFVRRTNQLIKDRKKDGEAWSPEVWLFHRGGPDGRVAYLEDASLYVC